MRFSVPRDREDLLCRVRSLLVVVVLILWLPFYLIHHALEFIEDCIEDLCVYEEVKRQQYHQKRNIK